MANAKTVQIIMGPTASGKSAYALELARQHNGWIINADAMQCYAPLPILSAQPNAVERAEIQHCLYGFAQPHENLTAAKWVELVIPIINQAWAANALPILCGGTGFYIKALTQGIAQIPVIDPTIRQYLQLQLESEGLPALYRKLQELDAVLAARLKGTDTQRILRGLEVYQGTGTPLSVWQQQILQPALVANYHWQVLNPPRAQLRQQIEERFDTMLQSGALDEVGKADISTESSAYKTHGFRELKTYLAGEMPLRDARARTILQTQQYAKRQVTWLRGQKLIETPVAAER